MTEAHGTTNVAAPLSLARIAEMVRGRLVGAGDATVLGVAPLDEAGPDELGFLALRRYVRFLDGSRAGAYLTSSELEEHLPEGAPRIVVDEPYPALRILLKHFHPEPPLAAAVHPTAVLEAGVRLGEGVQIGAYAVLERDVVVGDRTRIGAHCVLGSGSSVGDECLLHPHVVTYPGSALGSRVTVHSGARIGSDGFGYTRVNGTHVKMPQVGRARVEDDVEIGANTTIDRGSLGDTVIGPGSKIDNLVQVAHNVRIGAGSLLAALVGIAGSTRIGRGVWFGGRASAINHLDIGDDAKIAFGSTVMRDVPPATTVSGSPSRPHREQLKRQAQVGRIAGLRDRMARLETLVRG